MSELDWMKSVCYRRTAGLLNRAICSQPWSITVQGREQTVATNGHRLVLLDQSSDFVRASAIEAASIRVPINEALSCAGVAISLADFRAFLSTHFGEPLTDCATCANFGDVPCGTCKGVGMDVYCRPCSACVGAAYLVCTSCNGTWAEPRVFKIGPAYVNAATIETLLPRFERDDAIWRFAPGEPERPMAIETPRMKLIFAVMRHDDQAIRYPSAPVYDVGRTVRVDASMIDSAGSGGAVRHG